MTEYRDPPRLFESGQLDPELRHALRTAANDAPSNNLLQAMLSTLPVHEAPLAATMASPAKVMGKLLWLKVGGALLVSGALVWGLTQRDAAVAPTQHAAREQVPALALPPAVARQPGNVTRGPAGAGADQRSDAPRPETSQLGTPSGPAVSALPDQQARAVATPAAAEPAIEAARAVEVSSPTSQSERAGATAASRGAGVTTVARSRATAPLDARSASSEAPTKQAGHDARPAGEVSELGLLEQAQRALLRNPEQTLQLLELHKARFRDGSFREEREVLRLDALQQLGKQDELQRSAKRFLTQHPGSLHRQRVAAMLSAPAAAQGASGEPSN